ncbi:hypothetical protein Acsp06_43600 [Actinomycetospora sp. NBRC 106375]|uniref:toll/interleukin-1 receptor domain-containing protein n=1 Tax=Actinomycetospora sp. NBRC 106375 TaxID=3032207 RepID=UPI0024A4890B|nr:toll/interleukin-1 receptor domain-containing protein [Actinomycetospora sp. NBRC 106375]GLZ48175.1 hypothetical protein Acsp06_43600 [Actinomycetospora sp. NBRC 106375]
MFFLSYARADEPSVRALVEDLRQLGDVWRDHQIAGGQAWWREILGQIRVCDLFVFALSEASLSSEACRAEFNYAYATRRPILPVQVGKVASVPRHIGQFQIVDYSVGTTTGGIRLATAVRALDRQRPPLPSPLPPEPQPPEPRPVHTPSLSRRGRATGVALVLLFVLLVGGTLGVSLLSSSSTNPTGVPVSSSDPGGDASEPRAAMLAAVRDYYGVVTVNPAAGWARLSPSLQAQTGGFSMYQSFWSTVTSAVVVNANVIDGNTVSATVDFSAAGRDRVRETHELHMIRSADGSWLIDADRVS